MSHCQEYLSHKKRFCKFPPLPSGGVYCPMHTPSSDRIACPIDPNHTIFARDKAKHILICSKVKDREKVSSQKMFHKNLIKASDKGDSPKLEEVQVTEDEAKKLKTQLEKAVNLMKSRLNVVTRTSEPLVSEKICKHQIQQDLILTHLKTLFQTDQPFPDTLCICEFGCGKGGLAARLMEDNTAWEAKFLLVDREPRRNKRENKFKQGIEIVRLRMDLCDLDLSQINTQNVFTSEIKEIVIITKHLCGVATDLALLSAQRSQLKTKLCMATCCHHACDWHLFVGCDLFRHLGLAKDEHDFAKIRSVTGWATSGRASEEKLAIGRLAKTAIDLARCVWVTENLDVHKVQFVEYVHTDVTVENKLILAQ